MPAPVVRPLPPDPKTQIPALEAQLYGLVEAARLKIDPKARPLRHDAELARIAREKSQDMAAKHYLAHTAPDGETTTGLIMAEDANFHGLLGENIAAQYYTKARGVDAKAYARQFVAIWLASKQHRQNLAYPEYDRTGIGAAVNGNTVYVTELFAAGLGAANSPQGQQGAGPARDKPAPAAYPQSEKAKPAPPIRPAARP